MRTRRRGPHEEAAQGRRRLPRSPLGRDREEARERREGAGAALRASSTSCSRPRATSSPTRSTRIVIDDREAVRAACGASSRCSCPSASTDVKLYDEDGAASSTSTASRTRSARARRARSRCPRAGYLIIDQAEALTAIDVNTGRLRRQGVEGSSRRRSSRRTSRRVKEIAYQLRFRNIGGLIILDLIDMERAQEPREGAARPRGAALQKDKAKTTLNRISELGLIEMTRKRDAREPRAHASSSRASTATARASCSRSDTIAYEILRADPARSDCTCPATPSS